MVRLLWLRGMIYGREGWHWGGNYKKAGLRSRLWRLDPRVPAVVTSVFTLTIR